MESMLSAAAFSSIASMVLIILTIVGALAGSKDDVGYIGGRTDGKGDGNDDIGGKSKCETKQRPRGSGVHSLAS